MFAHVAQVGLICWGLGAFGAALASADGPDFFGVNPTQGGVPLAMQLRPDAAGATGHAVGTIPADGVCIRNQGCQGGLTLTEFTTLSPAEQAQRAAANPRWCKVKYQGKTGWVEGRFLVEAACPTPTRVTGTVKGYDSVDHPVNVLAGQTLTVSLAAKHPQTYFNLLPPHSQEAMFVGSSSGDRVQRVIAADGVYTVRVYLMRAAARRGATSAFTVNMGVTGQALPALNPSDDALVPGTPFHATAKVTCAVPFDKTVSECDVGVIRRSVDGTATVQVRWPQGVRHVLFLKGVATASDSARSLTTQRKADTTVVKLGDDGSFEVPDALLTGG